MTWHYQTLQDGTRTQQEALVVHLTSRQLVARLRSPLHVDLPVALVTNLQRLLPLAVQLTSRKRSLPLVEAHVVQGTNKNAV